MPADKEVECASPEIVQLRPVSFADATSETRNLRENTENAAASDNSVLALLYNELAARSAHADQNLSRDYEERAVRAWAHATEFAGEPVGLGGGNTLSPAFLAHVEQYQVSMGLQRTGRLDYETFATEANHDISPFLYGVYRELDAVATRTEPIQCSRPASSDALSGANSPIVTALVRAAAHEESVGAYGNAALLFNEAHARAGNDSLMASYTELRVYENVGHVLNVLNPVRCDPLQGRFVMTPAMMEAVSARQRQPTGILDYQTIRDLASIDVVPFLVRQPNR